MTAYLRFLMCTNNVVTLYLYFAKEPIFDNRTLLWPKARDW